MCTGKRRKKNLSNYPRRERGTEIIYGFALDFWTAAHEARMSGRILAPSAGYPVDTPPTPDAHVTISNKNSFFFLCIYFTFSGALYAHTHTRTAIGTRSSDLLSTRSYSIHENEKLYVIIIFPGRLINFSRRSLS
jgi:hypothetical protein